MFYGFIKCVYSVDHGNFSPRNQGDSLILVPNERGLCVHSEHHMIDARLAFLSCTPWHIREVLFLLAKVQLISIYSKSLKQK